jgi:putative spermidine/putrescine transport system permease protein
MKRSASWAWTVLGTVFLFYLLPMVAMARFAFQQVPVIRLGWGTFLERWTLEPMMRSLTSELFLSSAWLSIRIGILSVVLSLTLLVPTTVYVHVRLMKARPFVEILTILPYVVPPIALVVGIAGALRSTVPGFLASPFSLVPFYVVMALPFTFRSLDAGLRSVDLKTLVEASRSLGASWHSTVMLVILPNLKVGVINASFLTFAVVLGEFTVASLLLKQTLPTYLAISQGQNPQGTFAVGLLLMFVSAGLFAVMNRLTRGKSGQVGSVGY